MVQRSTQTKDLICVGVEWEPKYAFVSLLDPILCRTSTTVSREGKEEERARAGDWAVGVSASAASPS